MISRKERLQQLRVQLAIIENEMEDEVTQEEFEDICDSTATIATYIEQTMKKYDKEL